MAQAETHDEKQPEQQRAAASGFKFVCHECDLLQRADAVPRGGSLRCARCDAPLVRWASEKLDVPVALALTAAVACIVANTFPVMTLEFQTARMDASMLGSVMQLHREGETLVGLLVLFTAILAPAALIGLLLWLLLPLRLGIRVRGFAPLFRILMKLSSWAMVEVLMLGVVVALVKLGHMATTSAGIGLYAYGATMLLLALLNSSLQGGVIWAYYEAVSEGEEPEKANASPPAPLTDMHS